jgi:hypothetical protein
MPQKLILSASIFGLLTACALPGVASAPTPYPADFLPTVVYLTAESLNAQTGVSATATPIRTDIPAAIQPDPIPTIVPTLAPGIPLGTIQIISPGPMSYVASPMEVRAYFIAGRSNKVQIDLYGEDGRLLSRSIEFAPVRPLADYLFLKIPFQIRAAGENGLVQISTKDEVGRVQSLVSVRVVLISSGDNLITPTGNAIYEHLALYNFPDNSSVSGGVISLRGQFLPYNHQPLIIELISNDGKSLGTRVYSIAGLDPQNVTTTVPYKVGIQTQARLFFRQADDVLAGPVYVYSQQVTLNP